VGEQCGKEEAKKEKEEKKGENDVMNSDTD
jgi:hypothetical protein